MPESLFVFCFICLVTLHLEVDPTVSRCDESSSSGRMAAPDLQELYDTNKKAASLQSNAFHSF